MKTHHNLFLYLLILFDVNVSISGSPHMHRKPESELVLLDTELERTLRNLKKVRFVEVVVMAYHREMLHIPVEEIDRP